jgi:hypothetical protein
VVTETHPDAGVFRTILPGPRRRPPSIRLNMMRKLKIRVNPEFFLRVYRTNHAGDQTINSSPQRNSRDDSLTMRVPETDRFMSLQHPDLIIQVAKWKKTD